LSECLGLSNGFANIHIENIALNWNCGWFIIRWLQHFI